MNLSFKFRAQEIRTATLTQNVFKTNPTKEDEYSIQNQKLIDNAIEIDALKKRINELEGQLAARTTNNANEEVSVSNLL